MENSLQITSKYKKVFLRPKARVDEGIWLSQRSCVTSMMDVSDGLYIDLKRLCKASSVAGIINLDKLEVSNNFFKTCQSLKLDPTHAMLAGGEDYGLLFTAKAQFFEQLAQDF